MGEKASPSATAELAQFLTPQTRIDVRRSAIAYVVGVSGTVEGPQLFQGEDFTLARALCALFVVSPEERSAIFSALTNVASSDASCANYIIEKTPIVHLSVKHARDRDPSATFAAKLLSNLSIHFCSKVFDRIVKVWENFVSDTVALLNEGGSADFVDYMGYVLVNCTAMPRARRMICEKHLRAILPLVAQRESPKRRLIAVDIVRNLCFDDENHKLLLDEDDEFLTTLLKPLADASDCLDDEETEKLPLQLQYYDGERCKDGLIVQKIIEALFQLCATKHGRSVLRDKGAYAILREFDKVTAGCGEESAVTKGHVLLGGDSTGLVESTLHALIGVLIRYESEMDVDPDLSSIRHLQ